MVICQDYEDCWVASIWPREIEAEIEKKRLDEDKKLSRHVKLSIESIEVGQPFFWKKVGKKG